ncbi:MEMO1 family protein [Azospira sp. I13]|uniref:AmmeMemoRadiSam system protein B n=1 Tax=Azospira sp. I13 TaxID=1765050 RepID=UPI000D416A78|nr:AmmeMemoRadiSam system protein B [Azospira sp. I13]GBG01316.1 MEMO1 family protein [Azospira sp. I13]
MPVPRPTAVAGLFYPADPTELRRELRHYLANAAPVPHLGAIKALVVPHAGYIYSAAVAAAAYSALAPQAARIRRVILLGPTHRVPVHGMAVPATDTFLSPLGPIPLDQAARQAIADLPGVVVDDQPHAREHALEVQLPFLQTVLGSFELLPLAVGHCPPETVAAVLERLWDGDDTLIVVSSDLSHYLPYPQARRQDEATSRQVLALDAALEHDQACGATPLNGLLLQARRHGLVPRLLDLRNSGDTAGSREEVVGYAAFAFTPETTP